jgi:protein required for attachment to host cells
VSGTAIDTRPATGSTPSSLPTGGRPALPQDRRGESATVDATQDARRPSTPISLLNERRAAYSAVKAEIAAMPADQARGTVANHLTCPNDTVAGIKVGPLLKSIRFIAEPKMLRILRAAGTQGVERKTVGELTERQRRAIALELWRGVKR